ncbi:MAG: hypothetical protein H7X75_10475 [Burkholderiaceae bacterium]|nr:hypothetical protein [Burkholderiaceae bacterium]
MQHIAMRWESETGEAVANFDVNGIDVRIVERAPAGSFCLRFIDPYGDTIFNELQLPALVSELEQLRDATPEQELRAHIERVLAFLCTVEGPHCYVRFIGD